MWRIVVVLSRGYGAFAVFLGLLAVVFLQALLPPAIVLPQTLSDATVEARTSFIGCAVACVLVLRLCHEPVPTIARTAPRGWYLNRLLRVGIGTIVALIALSVVVPRAPDYVLAVLLLLMGEGLIGARTLGQDLSWLPPFAHAAAAALVGVGASGEPFWWAWIIQPDLTGRHVLLGLVVFAIAAHVWASHDGHTGDSS